MQPQVGPNIFDRHQDFGDTVGRAIALADRPNTHPHARLEPSTIYRNMPGVVTGSKALKDRQDRKRRTPTEELFKARHKGIISLDSKTLVLIYRHPRFGEHECFAHVILGNSCGDLNDTSGVQPVEVRSIFIDRVPVSAV